jgi:hypothetical protein
VSICSRLSTLSDVARHAHWTILKRANPA